MFFPIAAIVLALAVCIFAIVAYALEMRRQDAKLRWDIAQYWAICDLNVRREAAASLAYQRRRAKAEAFYRVHGYYPS